MMMLLMQIESRAEPVQNDLDSRQSWIFSGQNTVAILEKRPELKGFKIKVSYVWFSC